MNFGGGFAGALAVGSWLVRSWAMLPSSAISPCPALGAATLEQEEKQWPLEHVRRQNLGNEMEAMSKGGWHRDRPGDAIGVTFASAATIQQVSLSGSTTEGDESFKQTPKFDLKQL